MPERSAMRALWRRLRSYYKSRRLFRERLRRPWAALAYPVLGGIGRVTPVHIRFRSGRSLDLPAQQWPLLPVLCRLDGIGAETEVLADAKRVRLQGLELYSPLWTRNEADYYREVFLEDIYRVGACSRERAVVVDVGAYVGDSAIAFARAGAQVHAVEPADVFCRFIARNARANSLEDRIVLHAVGLGERSATIHEANLTLHLVEGVAYTLARLPQQVDVLKLDCEGAEYHLLADRRFLAHLQPREICMEYHRGPERVVTALETAGYRVTPGERHGQVGLLRASLGDAEHG